LRGGGRRPKKENKKTFFEKNKLKCEF
jgi:hypothetical protein